jgi:hypothetical protein
MSSTVPRLVAACCLVAIAVLAASATIASASFGLQSLEFSLDSAPPAGAEPGAVGPPQLQAGSHPYRLRLAFSFNQGVDASGGPVAEGAIKDMRVDLPAGLIGSLADVPQCAVEEFASGSLVEQGCPSGSQVGTMSFDTTFLEVTLPVFNLEPPPGEVAQLGVFELVSPMVMKVSVRTGGDYGLTVDMRNLPQFLPVLSGSLSLWGVPADPGHDTLRGSCLGLGGESLGVCASDLPRRPFLTLPGTCGEPLRAAVRVSSWEQPDEFLSETVEPRDGGGEALPLHGCEALDFSPSLEIGAESDVADTPSGFGIDLRLPQSENPDGLGEAGLRDVVLGLPAGVTINPAAADGLGACLPEQIGLETPDEPACPDSSRIGAVGIVSPLIDDPLQGVVYLAAPRRNEFDSVLAVYLTAESDGVLVKLAGRIDADPDSGRLTVVLEDIPQLPFSDFSVRFDGGPRAALALPPACGTFTATARLTPRSASTVPLTRSSDLVVGRGCERGFSPSFLAGATGSLAGRRTGLTLRLERADGEQPIQRFSATLPEGLLPLLSGIPPCPEPQAGAGSCDPASRIGSVAIAAGAGSHPLQLAGKVFLTGPYKGAPFGLSIAVPGAAGPFDLGLIVVRAMVSVDPRTARLEISTDPLPSILLGIPLRVRGFQLSTADRPGFLLAPTGCHEQRLSARVLGAGGAVASPSSPFFLDGCDGLGFAPRVSASTNALVTRAEGAAFRLAIRNPRGVQSNLRTVAVRFPAQLSPRLSAIQAACPRATFAADPASCPPGSRIGTARVRTPIFDVAPRGPAYLVSRGAEALPRIVLTLDAGGVALRLFGALHISEGGATAVRFASMPDAPISSFVLRLPRGPGAVLGASFLGATRGSLCGRHLKMPVKLVAHSGARSVRQLPVRVDHCK